MRVAHYLNQFFGGVGAEEHAGKGLEIHDCAVGPGRLLEQLLGGEARVILTFVCGDNFAVEHQDELTAAVLEKLNTHSVDLFVAGPCFDAGRYGMAAGAICRAVQAKFNIPAIAAMSEENPGVDLYRDALYIIDSGTSTAKMRDVLSKMARLSQKLITNAPIGLPAEEGYLRRGWLRDQLVEKAAAVRLVDMLMAKMTGAPFESEMPATAFAPVPMPAAISDLSKAKVMLITDGGLVPKGNPDRIEGTAATRWALTTSKAGTNCVPKTTKFHMAATIRGSCRKIPIGWFRSTLCARWRRAASSGSFTTNFFLPAAAPIHCRTRAASAGKWQKKSNRMASTRSS